MKTLNQTIGLGMICGSGLVSDNKEAAKMKPKGRCELGAAVRSDNRRNTKSGDPGMNKGGSAISCRGGRERYSFRPARGAVNDSKEIGIYECGKISGQELEYVGEEFWYDGELFFLFFFTIFGDFLLFFIHPSLVILETIL